MKRCWKTVVGLAVLIVLGAWLLWGLPSPELRELEKTRRVLRQEGFKIELREFDLSLPPELSRRAALLGTTTMAEVTNRLRTSPMAGSMHRFPPLLTPAAPEPAIPTRLPATGPKAAIPTWKLDSDSDLWAELHKTLDPQRARLELARQAAVSGPIRFEPIGSQRPNALLPYLTDLKNLTTTFGTLMLMALHDDQRDLAWTNLYALTCLATAYQPEPIPVSHLVRCGCVGIACDATWSALQAPGWSDAQLAALQTQWESLELWSGLPETAAHSRADVAALCELDRQQPIGLGMPLGDMVRSLKNAWSALGDYWNRVRYRYGGSYEEEKALLLYYRDRELELRRAVQARTWAEMRQLPGVTNFVPFLPGKRRAASSIGSVLNMRQMQQSFLQRSGGFPGRVADAEVRRRLVVTALALERYRLRHGNYPETLSALVPELLPTPPVDFMDGQPLRYRLAPDGRFALYSVGLDCVDNGGGVRQTGIAGDFDSPEGIDLAWARPASAAEIAHFQEETRLAERNQARDAKLAQAEAWWDITTRHQSNVEKILAAPPAPIKKEPVLRGQPLAELLSNRPGTNQLALFDLLALKPVVSGLEPETVAFELPIRYEALTNLAELVLCIDRSGPDYEEGWAVGHYECVRATNGDCRLLWNTIYETPGKHALLAELALKHPRRDGAGIFGPVTPYVVTNLCQFDPGSAVFDRKSGARLFAVLPEPNGTYRLDIKLPAGEPLRTFTGSTTNGLIEVHWDLKDDHGRLCTNNAYDSLIHVTLPASGREQTLQGP